MWFEYSDYSDNTTCHIIATANSTVNARSNGYTFSFGPFEEYLYFQQPGAPASLTVSPTSVSVPQGGGTGSFSISANVSWSVTDNVSWLTVSPTSGSNNGTVTVNATSANTATSARSATVTVTGGGITRMVTVTQPGVSSYLTVGPTSVSVPQGGGPATFSVSANVSWSVTDDASWLTTSPTSGSGDATVTVNATSANTATSSRSATVTVTGGGITRMVTVTQPGVSSYLTVGPTSVSVPQGGGPATFSVSANVSWSVTDDASWLTVSPTSGSGNGTVTVNATSANTATSARSATVTVTGGGITRTVTVTQPGAASTYITLTSPNGGEQWQVGQIHNITWTSEGTSGLIFINLFKDGNFYTQIANNLPNTGSREWEIPSWYDTSSSYYVEIFSLVNNSVEAIDYSDASFCLTEEPTISAVHRFWSDSLMCHFYTISEAEKNKVVANLPHVWRYEGVVFHAYPTQVAGTSPVHRFWSDSLMCHFYTISEAEKNKVVANLPHVWRYEGVVFHAYPTQVAGTSPVYRFWSDVLMCHFYTISEAEKNKVIANLPHVWRYEGPVYYAFPATAQRSATATSQELALASTAQGEVSIEEGLPAIEPLALTGEDEVQNEVGSDPAVASNGPDDADAVIFPLSYPGREVTALVDDILSEEQTPILNGAVSPTDATFAGVQTGRSYRFEVWVDDPESGELILGHRSWFERQLDDPDLLREGGNAPSAEKDDGVGSPKARIKMPSVEGTMTVRLYSSSEGVVETVDGAVGGETIELTLPKWNQWYWVSGRLDADNELVLSLWLRHEEEAAASR